MEEKSFIIPWYVAVECIRLYQSIIEQTVEATNSKSLFNHFVDQFNYCTSILEYYNRRGPILQQIDVSNLPPVFESCKNEQEIREMNMQIQQAFISGIKIELQEMKL